MFQTPALVLTTNEVHKTRCFLNLELRKPGFVNQCFKLQSWFWQEMKLTKMISESILNTIRKRSSVSPYSSIYFLWTIALVLSPFPWQRLEKILQQDKEVEKHQDTYVANTIHTKLMFIKFRSSYSESTTFPIYRKYPQILTIFVKSNALL